MATQPGREAGRFISVRFRGDCVSEAQIQAIRALIRRHRAATRSQIATLVCQAFEWRRPNGELNVRSCRDLLVRLEDSGQIQLPASKRRRTTHKMRSLESHSWDPEPPRVGPSEVVLRGVVVRPISRREIPRWREAMRRFHYLGDGEIVGECMRYVAESDSQWLALLGWGAAALKSRHREAFIGWPEKLKLERLSFVANNVRFLMLPWVEVPHLASFVLAANLRRLSDDWQRVYGHRILLAETFVDLKRFRATCYRASNWKYLGDTRGMRREGKGYAEHGQPKGIFVYPLEPRAREILTLPFPSPEILEDPTMAAIAIDVNKLPLEGKGGLIEVFRDIKDPRNPQGLRHPFPSVLALAVMAALSGMKSYAAIAQWASSLPKEIFKRLRCWCHQAPSEPTFRRVLQSVDSDEVDQKVGQWMMNQPVFRKAEAVALDGKTLRGSGDGDGPPCHLLAAVTHEEGVVIAQRNVGEKTNEITQAAPLLKDLDLEGKTVTADAMHTQRDFARFVVEEKKADYVLIAKENQPTLLEDIKLLHDTESFPPSGELA